MLNYPPQNSADLTTSERQPIAITAPATLAGLIEVTSGRLRQPLSRDELLALLALFACLNGLWSRIIHSAARSGWIDAIFRTFDTSVIVLFACGLGISLIFRNKSGRLTRADLAVGCATIGFAILPIGGLSWFALTGLCLYIIAVSHPELPRNRGAKILLAATVPMLWSLMLYQFFANLILNIDASLISWLLGTERSGNMVQFLHGPDYLVILPACSSLANTSLAFVCWVTMAQAVGHRWSPRDLFWCGLSCASVVSLNILRMSLMGLSYQSYEAIHSALGNGISNLIITTAALTVCIVGLRREVFAA